MQNLVHLPVRRVIVAAIVVAALAVPIAVAQSSDDGSSAASAGGAAATDANPGGTPLLRLGPDGGGEGLGSLVDVSITGTCDELDPRACLLPFPSDRFTVADPSTDTGRRVQLDALAMPRNVAGKPIDPTEWNRQDGFSPSSPVLTYVPGIDLHVTWNSEVDHIADLARYRDSDAPIVLLDATTGQRHPFWSELDEHAGTTDANRLLILRPATQLLEGHRYIVALRQLRRADGTLIEATPQFRAYRDGTHAPFDAPDDFDERKPHIERLFTELEATGVARDDLYLTWDFTVASTRNLSERVLRLRDETFAALGDTDLADRQIAGRAPGYTVTAVEDRAEGTTMRRVEGTLTVPNYLTPQVEVTTDLPQPIGDVGAMVEDLIDQLPPEAMDALDPVTGALPINPLDILSSNLSVPQSRFNTIGSTDGLPAVDPLQPFVEVPFVCSIPRSASGDSPSHPMLYGHGLLGSRTESEGSSTSRLRERGFTPCAVDWWGFSFADLPNVAASLLDASNFPSVIDRAQQGFLNFLVLGRALTHPAGFASHPAFQDSAGQPLVRAGDLYYDGNSQGAIMGGALTALAPDFRRSVLGVPGMAYSTLLNRSVDWEGEYGAIFEAAYPDPIGQQIGYVLFQMLWDRGESAGYAQHMSSDPLPGTPTHEVMLQVAFGDHQVANVSAEVEARTIGASLFTPVLPPNLHWSLDPLFGFRTVSGDRAQVGSVLVYWYAEGYGNVTPPNGNVPAVAGRDPHGAPRAYGPATDQVARFLLTGDLIDVCKGGPCTIPAPP